MNIIRKEAQYTSNWSGGTTTELFIYPPEAHYSQRNFQFRISTATVETETSNFTPLPDYKRILMILKGELEITHAGLYTKKLLPFEQDTFDGSWQTSAKGIVTDFNIMFSESFEPILKAHKLASNNQLLLQPTSSFGFVYLVSGSILLNTGITLAPGDFMILNPKELITAKANRETILLEISVTVF